MKKQKPKTLKTALEQTSLANVPMMQFERLDENVQREIVEELNPIVMNAKKWKRLKRYCWSLPEYEKSTPVRRLKLLTNALFISSALWTEYRVKF